MDELEDNASPWGTPRLVLGLSLDLMADDAVLTRLPYRQRSQSLARFKSGDLVRKIAPPFGYLAVLQDRVFRVEQMFIRRDFTTTHIVISRLDAAGEYLLGVEFFEDWVPHDHVSG